MSLRPPRAATLACGILFWTVTAIVYLPILVMAVFSFNSGRFQTLPFRGLTIGWYARVLGDPLYAQAFLTSVLLAGVVAALATALAFACAYALVKARFPGKGAFAFVMLGPLVVPLLLIGMALRLWFARLGLEPGLVPVTIGQVLYVLPLALLNLRNRLAQLPPSHEEAARALGATRLTAVREVVLPACALTLVATFLLTFTFAFDEFVIAYFLTNFEITLPIKIWTTLVTGFDPTINAAGTLVFLFSLALGLAAQLLATRLGR
jgi:spermidine/putrescine transport system permease protein